MSNILTQWEPSSSAINLIKLNGVGDDKIKQTLYYLKTQTALSNIDDVKGYENWNEFFIMFCIKAVKKQ